MATSSPTSILRVMIILSQHQIIARCAAYLFRHCWRDTQSQRFLQGRNHSHRHHRMIEPGKNLSFNIIHVIEATMSGYTPSPSGFTERYLG
jgi:hypothetical protein